MFGIYGPGVMNDTIVPGYGVTKFPVNLTAFNMLPDGTTRNFGLSTQYVTYNNPMMSGLDRFLAKDITNPNHISQWDPMLFTLGCPQMNQYNSMTNPFLTQLGIQQAMNFGYQRARMNRINSMVQNMARALGSLEAQLTNLIKNDQLTDKQKAKLEAKLEEVKELKERIEEAIQNQASLEELEVLGGELVELQKSISEVIKEIAKEVKESNNDDDGDDGVSENENDDTESSEKDNDGRPSSLGEKPSKSEIEMICSGIDAAYAPWYGTDKEKLDQHLSVLTKDNIIEVITHWNKNYTNNSSGKSKFFESMMDELNDWEQDNRIPQILTALQERAEALGIYDEIQEFVSAVNKELHSSWENDKVLSDNLEKIVDKIVAKEKSNATDKKGKSEKAEADKKKEDAKKAKEAKATFLSDLREYFDDEKLEISDKVQYKDGKFKIHTTKGKSVDYEASDFMGLVKKLENDDLDPKKYLAKQKVDTKA